MISLRTNVSAAMALNYGRINQMSISKSTRNLSTGLRINHAADDPSGLAISQGMRARIVGLEAASANIQDDILMIHTADSVMSEMQDILMRIRDLAVRGANEPVLTDKERDKINSEIVILADELARAANSITYNTKNIFTNALDDGETSNGEYNITEASAAQIAAMGGDTAYEKFKEKVQNMLPEAAERAFEYLGVQNDLDAALTVNLDFSYAGPAAGTGTGTGTSISIQINSDTVPFYSDEDLSSLLAHEMTHALTIGEGVTGVDATNLRHEMLSQYVSQEVNSRLTPGGNPLIQAQIAGALDSNVNLTNQDYARAALAAQYIYNEHGRDAWINIVDYMRQNPGATYTGDNGAIVTVLDYDDWASFEAAADAYSAAGDLAGGVAADSSYVFSQIGSRQVRFNVADTMQVGADNVSSNRFDIDDGLSIVDFRFLSARATKVSQATIDNADHAIESISTYRAKLGVIERRLLHTLDDISMEVISVKSSMSTIRDADMAEEISQLTRAQILQQSNLVAQSAANAGARIILDLLP